MSAAPEISNRARDGLARWERDGEVVGFVSAATMCFRPRRPQFLTAVKEGFEVKLPCRECLGCLEYQVLILCRRLKATYRAIAAAGDRKLDGGSAPGSAIPEKICARLFAVRIECRRDDLFNLNRRLHHWRGVEVEPGFFRWGTDSFVVLSRRPAELVAKLEGRGWRVRTFPIGDPNRTRSWRIVARGLVVARLAYGENINRFYRRGLAKYDKEHFEIERSKEYRTYDRGKDERARSVQRGNLLPPRLWELRPGTWNRIRPLIRRATSPRLVDGLVSELLEAISKRQSSRSQERASATPDQRARALRAYHIVAGREADHLINAKLSDLSSPPLVGGVTQVVANSSPVESSPAGAIHSSGAPPPPSRRSIREEAEVAEASEKHRSEFLAQRSKKKLDDAFARLLALAERSREK